MKLILLVLLLFAAPAQAQVRRVVLLYDERTDLPGLAVLDARLTRTLTSALPGQVEVYRETMDLSRFSSPRYPLLLKDYLRAKYEGKPIDVVITVLSPALDFMLAHGAEVFPGASIVFCGIDRRDLGARQLPAEATGVLLKREFAPTLTLALRLHPGTRRVLLVSGSSAFDHRLLEAATAEFRTAPSRPPVEYLTGLPLPALLDTLAHLPAHTVVLYSTMFADSAGRPYVPHEVVAQIARAANAPVYGFVDQYLGRGIVGGHLYSLDAHGEAAGQLALRVLAGTAASAIPPIEPAASMDMFDWRELRRWRIDERRLPAGAIVRYRSVSVWERYRPTILITAGVLLLESALIVWLLLERRVRRRAQAALRTSEARGQIAGVSLGVGFWSWDAETDRVWISEQCARLLGFDPGTEPQLGAFLAAVRPRADGPLNEAFERAIREGAPFDGEWAIGTDPSGAPRWIAGAVRTSEEKGAGRRVTGALIDVTERRAAERTVEEQRRELAHLGRVAMVGELSATLAHEINQPLGAIVTNARAAERLLGGPDADKPELRVILEDIAADGWRAAAVVQHVRGLVKKDQAEPELLSLNEVVGEVLELAQADLRHRRVGLSTRLDSPAPLVFADRIQLQQVLLNLIINACDAMTDTPSRERLLLLSTTAHEGKARIEVHDRGTGIPPDGLSSVFEPFMTTKRDGMGLGLTICRSIVTAHGGQMWAVNNPERGATFVVALPLAEQPGAAADAGRLASTG
ncbi:MAG TPA: ATP-binding protein [Gemmatimonadales bacterium]|nr:ATP-binding protein [Gemmatimonadales bacterium]